MSDTILEQWLYSENQKNLIHNALIRHLEAEFFFGPHCHRNIELCLMQMGACDIIVNGETITVHSHEFIILFPNVIHSFYVNSDKPCQFLQLHFRPENFLNLKSKIYQDHVFYTTLPQRAVSSLGIALRPGSCPVWNGSLMSWSTRRTIIWQLPISIFMN